MDILSSITVPKTPIKVAIIGSCVTRDVFNSKFNNNYKDFFELTLFQHQTTIMSLLSKSIEYNDESIEALSGWDKKMIEMELNKRFFDEVIKVEPDVLVIDFFADARFKTIAVGEDRFLTVNEWKTTKTKLYKEIEKTYTAFIPSDKELKDSFIKFDNFFKEKLPQTTIILNQARGASSYTDKDNIEQFFPHIFLERLNKRWEHVDNLFIEVVNPKTIDIMIPQVKGYVNHLWSIAYVHYTPNFYSNFLNTLISIQFQNQVEFLKSSLAKLVPSGLFPTEKEMLINEIRAVYISLPIEEKEYIDSWLDGRYEEFLTQLSKYNKNIHSYVKFINFAFRNGIKGVIARDMSFSKYMIEKIIDKKIFNHETISSYAYLTYGGILYGFYNAQKDGMQKKSYFKNSRKYLLLAEENSTTDYVKNRSRYFLANLYSLNQDFENSLAWYLKSLKCKSLAPNSYSLLFSLLIRSIDVQLLSYFKNIKKVFTEKNVQNRYFWIYFQSQIKNKKLSNNINLIIENCEEANSDNIQKWNKEIKEFFEFFSDYLKEISYEREVSNFNELYKSKLLTEKGRAYLLFCTSELYSKHDLSRAILLLSESNGMVFDIKKLNFMSDLILENFSEEIRKILKENKYVFKNSSVNLYCDEQTRNSAGWKRFLTRGCLSGDFDEEVEFLEFLLKHTRNILFQKVLHTRIAYLYYTGTAGVSIDHYIKPDIAKSKEFFKEVKGNPLVSKYLNHPRLAIYQDMEQYIDNQEEKYLFFENQESDELLIVFSCAGSYSRYTQLKLFYEKNKTNVLFINNPKYNWYHGSEWERTQKIIEQVALKNFTKENIISYFGSMGGYVALRVGLTYGFRTVVFNPQIDLNLWIRHRPSISVRLNQEKELVHLQDLPIELYENTPIYYITSSSMEDVEAFKIFIDKISLCKKGLFIIEKIPDNVHDGIFGLTYKGREQEAILGLAKMQQHYYPLSSYVKLDNKVEELEVFWTTVKESMSLRLIIQIRESSVYTLDIQKTS